MKTFINYCEEQQINEGFWEWLMSFFKSLFENDPNLSLKTKQRASAATKYLSEIKPNVSQTNRFNRDNITQQDINAEAKKILSEDTAQKLIKHLEEYGKMLLKNKIFDAENLLKWKLTILYMAIQVAKDKKKEQDVLLLQKHFDKLAENNKELADEIRKTIEQNASDLDASLQSALPYSTTELYNSHKKIIKSILMTNNITINDEADVIKPVNSICNNKNISDSKIYYGLILVRFGKEILNNEEIALQFANIFFREQGK